MGPPKKPRALNAETPPEALHLSKAYRVDLDVLLTSFQGTSSGFWASLSRFQDRFRALDWRRTVRLLKLCRTALCPVWHSSHVRAIDEILVERYVELSLGFRCGKLPRQAKPKDAKLRHPPAPPKEIDAAVEILSTLPSADQADHIHRLASFLTRSKRQEDSCVVAQPISANVETKRSPWTSNHAGSILSAARRYINVLTPALIDQRWCILLVAFRHREVHVFGPEEMYDPNVSLRRTHWQVINSLLRVIDWAAGPAEYLRTPHLAPEIEFPLVFHHMTTFDDGDNFVQVQRLMFRIYESGIPETRCTRNRFRRFNSPT